jgi:ketosteroid isomerase-like protein
MHAGAELVREIIESLNRGDVDAMLERMHPDFEWTPLEASPVSRVCRGHNEVRHYVEDWLSTLEGVRLDLGDPDEIGDRVLVPVHGHGRGRASGLVIDNRFCQLWTVRDGTAVAMQEYATRDDALAALR